MVLDHEERSSTISSRSILAFTALVCEAPILLVLIIVWSAPGTALDPAGTDAQPGLAVLSWFAVAAVCTVVLVAAVWRPYWSLAAIQIALLLVVVGTLLLDR